MFQGPLGLYTSNDRTVYYWSRNRDRSGFHQIDVKASSWRFIPEELELLNLISQRTYDSPPRRNTHSVHSASIQSNSTISYKHVFSMQLFSLHAPCRPSWQPVGQKRDADHGSDRLVVSSGTWEVRARLYLLRDEYRAMLKITPAIQP